MNQQTGQRNHNITYVIVAIILVALALVAVYGVRQATMSQNEPPISSESIAEHRDDTAQQKTDVTPAAPKQDQKQDEKQSAADRKDTQTQSPSQQSQATTLGPSDRSAKQPDRDLPATRPVEDALVVGAMLAVLAGAALAYRRSSLFV